MFFKITRIWCSVNGEPPWCTAVKKKRLLLPPQKSSGKSFSGSVLLIKESFFRWTTQYSKSYKIRFISVGKPLITGPKCWDTALASTTPATPEAHFLLNECLIEKHSKCKEHPDVRVQWNLWKTARCGSTGCHEGFMFLGSSKSKELASVAKWPSSGWIPNWKIKIFPLNTSELGLFGNSELRDGEAMIFRPRSRPKLAELNGKFKKTTVFRQLWEDSAN